MARRNAATTPDSTDAPVERAKQDDDTRVLDSNAEAVHAAGGEPAERGGRSWFRTLKRTIEQFRADNLTDWAAALTYYAVLALFPALIVFVAILGLAGEYPRTTNAILGIVQDVGPASAVDTFRGPIEGVVRQKGGAGALLGVGLLVALWSASSYIGAFMRASNAIYGVDEGRPFWKLRPLQVLVTIVMVLLLALVSVSVVVTGPVAKSVGDAVGLGDTAVTAWNIAKWPVMAIVVTVMIAFLYHVAPNVRQPRFRWISPGGILAILTWALASFGFAFYVANFGSYNETYGTLGGVVVFLLWLWLTNLALLIGAEFNAELERERELAAGLPAKDDIQLEPRQTK